MRKQKPKRKKKPNAQPYRANRPRTKLERNLAIVLIGALTFGIFGGLAIPGMTTPAVEYQTTPPLIGPESPAVISPPPLTWTELVEIQSDVEIYKLIEEAATDAGIDPLVAIRIAECESQLDPFAKNPNSTAKGLYQFLDSTWRNIGATGSPYNVEENIAQFMKWYPQHPEWWVCK